MDGNVIQGIIENEREWRRYLMSEIECIKKQQIKLTQSVSNLKIKVAFLASAWSIIVSLLIAYAQNRIIP